MEEALADLARKVTNCPRDPREGATDSSSYAVVSRRLWPREVYVFL
jgi:hypothetical protein